MQMNQMNLLASQLPSYSALPELYVELMRVTEEAVVRCRKLWNKRAQSNRL
jgi:hypothetical protein